MSSLSVRGKTGQQKRILLFVAVKYFNVYISSHLSHSINKIEADEMLNMPNKCLVL